MANDENKIILEFPATNVEIEFGETITFDNISGFLDSGRVTYNGESLTEEIAHLENDKADNTKIALEYDEEKTYYRGDIVLYNGVLYECDVTDTSGEFYPSDWKEITLGEGIEEVKNLLDSDYYTKIQSDYRFLGKTNPSGTGYFSLNRRGSAGAYSVSVGRLNEANAQSSFAEGESNTSSGYASHSEGYGNVASGTASHAESWQTTASGDASHAEGESTIASAYAAHSEGETTTASGDDSHAEGKNSTASGNVSHAEGENNTASGYGSHAEGYGNTASGLMAHAEGVTTESSGYGSHSEGVGTIANHIGQHVFGTYNVADPSTAQPTAKGNYIEIVGNGTDDNRRRNARTLDWSGNETLMGDLTYNGNKSLTSEISRLDGKIDNLPSPMIFKGTLGVGGTIQTLPAASASNEGYTYKVITDGTYAEQTAKVGDVFTSNGSEWVLIPSGDEDNDTWRNIKVNGVEKLGNGISSGAVDFEDTANVKFEFDANGNKIRAKLEGIYTESEVDDLLDDKADADNTYTKEQVDDIVYNILPDDTASGSVANFTTSLELPIKSLEVDVNAVQESGTPTPETPLPISGRSAISLVSCGKNLFDEDTWFLANGYTKNEDGSYYRSTTPLNAVMWENKTGYSGQISLSFLYKYDNANAQGFRPVIRYTDGTTSPIYTSQTTSFVLKTATSTSGKTVRDIVTSYGSNIGSTLKDFQIELGSSASTFESFNGNTAVINLGGTYYGGHFTQDKDGHRHFEVTHKSLDWSALNFRRSNNSGNWANYLFFASVSDMKYVYTQISDIYSIQLQGNIGDIDNYKFGISFSGSIPYVYFRNDDYTDVETFTTAMLNHQLVYELATPYTIDLPDGEPIITLNGTNNIYADTGDTSVVFKDSVNGYVEKKIASVQALALNT